MIGLLRQNSHIKIHKVYKLPWFHRDLLRLRQVQFAVYGVFEKVLPPRLASVKIARSGASECDMWLVYN